jgi:hypothetical protein
MKKIVPLFLLCGFLVIGTATIFLQVQEESNIVIEYACVKEGSFSSAEKVTILGLEHTRDICPAGTEMIKFK